MDREKLLQLEIIRELRARTAGYLRITAEYANPCAAAQVNGHLRALERKVEQFRKRFGEAPFGD